jgi:hypothetical protein
MIGKKTFGIWSESQFAILFAVLINQYQVD